MEETQTMSKFLSNEKNLLDKAEKQIQKSIIKSSCQKAIKINVSSIDINNNQTDSESWLKTITGNGLLKTWRKLNFHIDIFSCILNMLMT